MVEPVDAILAFHNALRNDIRQIDVAALNIARGDEGFSATLERFKFFNEALVWHAHGEERAIFPALENVAPLVAEAYIKDHRGLDAAFEELNTSYKERDPLKTARATAVFRFHLDIHLYKEDTHLYRLFRERVPMPKQWKASRVLASAAPPDRFPEVMVWLFPLVELDDSENLVRTFQTVMPPQFFSQAKELIKKAMGTDWIELTYRIPTLEEQ